MSEAVNPDLVIDNLSTRLALTGIPWDKPHWAAFLKLSPSEQALEVQMLADSAVIETDAWNTVLTILNDILIVAAGVAGIAGAISAVQTVMKG